MHCMKVLSLCSWVNFAKVENEKRIEPQWVAIISGLALDNRHHLHAKAHSQIYFFWVRAKRIRDRSVISPIKPQFDNRCFVDSRVLYNLWTWNCFASSAKQKQFQVRNLYKTHKSTKIWLPNWGLIEETMVLSRILFVCLEYLIHFAWKCKCVKTDPWKIWYC